MKKVGLYCFKCGQGRDSKIHTEQRLGSHAFEESVQAAEAREFEKQNKRNFDDAALWQQTADESNKSLRELEEGVRCAIKELEEGFGKQRWDKTYNGIATLKEKTRVKA